MKKSLAFRSNAPLAILGLLLGASLLLRCGGSSETAGSPDAGAGAGGGSGGISGTAGVPSMSCTQATVAVDCPLPHSTCSGNDLVYYSGPTCEMGTCQWTTSSTPCYGGCVAGFCSLSTTTTAPPPPNTGGAAGYDGGTTSYGTCSGGEAGVTGTDTCPLPASSCLDASTLLYFSNAVCVQGTCQASVNAMNCYSGCSDGGCLPNLTK